MTEQEIKEIIAQGIEGAAAEVQKAGRVAATVAPAVAVSGLILLKARGFDHLSAISCTEAIPSSSFP